MSESLRSIGSDEFFYVLQDNYDEHIELAIPMYREMHAELVRCAPEECSRFSVLDLGCGTGKTAAVFLASFPDSTVVGIDLFEGMLTHARRRLSPFGGRVSLHAGDFRTAPLGTGFCVVVSALAIHHCTPDEKQDLFRRVHEALEPGGRFLMMDWTKFTSPSLQETSALVSEKHARQQVDDPAIVDEWVSHWRAKNRPETVPDLLTWLLEAGFSSADCVMRYYGMALICAEK